MNRSFAANQLTVEAPAFILFRSTIDRVVRVQICWQIWIQHVETALVQIFGAFGKPMVFESIL